MRTVPVSRTKVRSPDGRESSFSSREEFRLAIERGGVSADWSVYHAITGRWLPVTEHPVFRAQHDMHDTVRPPDATQITARTESPRDHVSVIEAREPDKAASVAQVLSDRAKAAIRARRERFCLGPRTQRSLMISSLLLFLAVGVLGTSRYVGRSLERHLSLPRAGDSQP